jgi:hypothetical protein
MDSSCMMFGMKYTKLILSYYYDHIKFMFHHKIHRLAEVWNGFFNMNCGIQVNVKSP